MVSNRRIAVLSGLVLAAAVIVLVPWADLGEAPESLSEAVEAGDPGRAEELLAEGADPDQPRVFGMTPLMRAVIRNDTDMVSLLLDAGADPDLEAPEGLGLLHIAAQTDAKEVIEMLLGGGADPERRSLNGMNALDHAAVSGSVTSLEVLVAAGVDPDAPSGAVSQGHGYPRTRGATPIMLATASGEMDAVTTLLDLGAGVNSTSANGQNALLVAVFTDQSPALVEILLRHGADSSVVAVCDAACSGPPGNAFHWAEQLDRDDLVPVLLEHADLG